jgi:1-acyl-sn-glycerol-3-phosphate acyltransferase
LKLIRSIALKIYTGWVIMVFLVFMILYLPGILIPFLIGEKFGTISYKFLKLWSWTFSKLNFIRYDIRGRNHIEKGQSYIYVSNHTSYLDIPGMCLTVPTQVRPLAKKELGQIPVFGWIVKPACIIVDRSSSESRIKSMTHLKEVLKRGISILVYPEGTQNRTSQPLTTFFDGAFRIAVETQQPILPMVIVNAGNLMPAGKIQAHPGTIVIEVDEPIETAGLTLGDVANLKQKTYDKMLGMINKINKEIHWQP